MGWFRKSKTKEEKTVDLQREVDELNKKYKQYFNKFCLWGSDIVIYEYFFIKDGEIYLAYTTINTPKGYITNQAWWRFKLELGEDMFNYQRLKFIRIKETLEKFGFEIKKIGI